MPNEYELILIELARRLADEPDYDEKVYPQICILLDKVKEK
jgi:hypothetical protein